MTFMIDKNLNAAEFLELANQVWPGEYDAEKTGSELMRLAREHTPTMLYFGAQPGLEGFYEKNGCRRRLQSYEIGNR